MPSFEQPSRLTDCTWTPKPWRRARSDAAFFARAIASASDIVDVPISDTEPANAGMIDKGRRDKEAAPAKSQLRNILLSTCFIADASSISLFLERGMIRFE